MKNKILLAIVLIIGVILTLFVLWDNGIIIINKTSEYEVRGVDVSAYQGDIDWDILAEEDIQFAFIKATEGSSYVDEKFETNYENAIKTDLKIGAYHFFSYDSEGTTQADNYIKNVPKSENMLPPVIDIEFYGEKYRDIPDIQETQKQLTDMIEKLEEYYGKKPIIYATYKSYDLYIANNFNDYPIWIRDVFSTPELSDNRDWTFWQYTDKAKLKGYNGEEKSIDVNVFKGSIEELENLCKTTIQNKEVKGFIKEINSEYISVTDGEGNITKVEIKDDTYLTNYRTEEIIEEETEGFIYWIKLDEQSLEDEFPLITFVEIYDK